jgi:hypothetical protein
MSAKDEIKNAFTLELKTTPQYQIVLAIKNLIMQEIATPHILSQIIYNFETQQTDEEVNIIKLCMIVEFGFDTNNISSNSVIIDMKYFL